MRKRLRIDSGLERSSKYATRPTQLELPKTMQWPVCCIVILQSVRRPIERLAIPCDRRPRPAPPLRADDADSISVTMNRSGRAHGVLEPFGCITESCAVVCNLSTHQPFLAERG
jgi:hypothetical protein